MTDEQPERFFVTITAADPKLLSEIGRFGLDLFSHRHTDDGPELGGLVTLDDVRRLVESGYRVVVHETDTPRRKHEFVTLDAWRDQLIADLKRKEKRS